MKLGMIVRADFGRGLANQTYSFWKHLKPDVTVVVDISLIAPTWPQDFSAYPGAIITQWRGFTAPFEDDEALKALWDCDLIYTAETYYDERLQDVPAVLHVNPEFYRDQRAAQYWYPTVWETARLPPGHIIPTPIADEDIALDLPDSSVLLHVGGHRAMADRNGSQIVHGILQRVPYPWRISSQDGFRLHPRTLGYVTPLPYQEDRWRLYDGAGILVYPRRYGGQSLQVNEAMARGLAVVMTDCSPNIETWPIIPVPSRPAARVKTAGGMFGMHMAIGPALADTLETLVLDREMLERWQARSLMWARDNAWSQWQEEIEVLIGR